MLADKNSAANRLSALAKERKVDLYSAYRQYLDH